MSENEVKKAFNAIEPEDGTRERMYANILKKAAAQRAAAPEENADAPAAESNASPKTVPLPARRPTPRWKRYSAMAACLALVTTLTIGFLHPFFAGDSEGNEPPVLGGSPFGDVQSAADFEEKLGFVIDAPEGAENVTYCIYDGEIARVDFTLDGRGYTYEAAKLDGNFSRADGEAVGSTALNAEYGATLDRVSLDTWRAHWNRDDVSYYLTNFDGAEESAITEIADTLMKSN
ncbi:MAG: hypothetical protein ACLR77_11530 [Oscillospiraceae bacterium]|jgi:hypothetical protein|uniref:hypothetical protein n=1 Tax=Dysosmobacter sp. TaxID=2591382 RepID=UPI0015B9709D